jgi:hypothetical protein
MPLLFLLLLLPSPCFSGVGNGNLADGVQSVTVPADSVAVPKLVWRSAQVRPAWIYEEPPESEQVDSLMFLGQSNYCTTEREAREDALRDVVVSTIVFARLLLERRVESTRMQRVLVEGGFDTYTFNLKIDIPLAIDLATAVQAQDWYLERWQTAKGMAYLAFVRAKVQKSTIDRSLMRAFNNFAEYESGFENHNSQIYQFWQEMGQKGIFAFR